MGGNFRGWMAFVRFVRCSNPAKSYRTWYFAVYQIYFGMDNSYCNTNDNIAGNYYASNIAFD